MPNSIVDAYSEWTNKVQEILHAPDYSTEKRIEELDKLRTVLLLREVHFKKLAETYISMADTTRRISDEMVSNAYGYRDML